MPKKREKTLEDLLEIADKVGFDADNLDGELRDTINVEADILYEKMKDKILLNKLEFLHQRGFYISRLEQLIRESKGA